MPTEILEKGLCSGGGDEVTRLMYDAERVREAKAICIDCPVRLECLHYAIRNRERDGVWGGTSERRREREFQTPYRLTGALPRLCKTCRRAFVKRDGDYCKPSCDR